METKRKEFQVEFPEHLSEDDQREALNRLNAAFDRQDIPAHYAKAFWLVGYEETEESTQGNITFDAPSTNGEKVIERWRKRNVPISLSGKHTLDKAGDFPQYQEEPSGYCEGCVRIEMSKMEYGQVFPAFKAVGSDDCDSCGEDDNEETSCSVT
tara:strand:- start:50 stop:511 length:462 start_codon:yes stop_codon:yes gene_type:complete